MMNRQAWISVLRACAGIVALGALGIVGVLTCGAVIDALGPREANPLQAAAEPNAAEAAIRKVLDEQDAAWNKGDLEGFMAGYWKSDELTFYSGKDKQKGWNATLERYRKRYQGEGKEMGTVTFSELQIQVLGNGYALVKGRWELKQSKETLGGLFTLVFQKTKDGWKIIHDHTSS